MDKFFELVGLGTPFLYAYGTFALFKWLDANASNEAKAEIARLLEVRQYDTKVMATTIVGFFDKVYTYPLFTWRALRRSALITAFLSAIWLCETSSISPLLNANDFASKWVILLFMLTVNIISDFISLFIVRRWLFAAGRRPIFALVTSSLIFLFVVAISSVLRIVGMLVWGSIHIGLSLRSWNIILGGMIVIGGGLLLPIALMIPALVVFAWLPLFGLSLAIVRAANTLRPVVKKVQWAVKEGGEHPLTAVGYVAAVIVFCGTILWRHLRGDVVAQHAFDYWFRFSLG
jgi:hypothetical protein